MAKLPKLPSLKKTLRFACECGCGGPTQARFVPGHDSKLKSRRMHVEAGMTFDELAQYISESEVEATARSMGLTWERSKTGTDE